MVWLAASWQRRRHLDVQECTWVRKVCAQMKVGPLMWGCQQTEHGKEELQAELSRGVGLGYSGQTHRSLPNQCEVTGWPVQRCTEIWHTGVAAAWQSRN